MEESEQVPLLTKAKYLTNPSSASSSSSCETREETEDLCLPISRNEEEEEAEEENSPVREVALTVPTTDDPSLPVLTFRMWVLGTLSCILLSFLNQFFWYRREPLTISAISAQIAVVPLGRLMAAKITDRVFLQGLKWEFTLNPGPFNVKEHVLITIFANAGAGSVYAIHIITAVKAYYMKNMTFFVSFIVIVTTQVLGFGWAGIFRKYLVEPAAMWWPANLVQVSLFSGPVMKLYLWDDAAREFCKKFKSYEITPTVLLVTTVNTKTIGGTLGLTSMSSSRVFMEGDVQPTIEYLGWLRSNPGVAEQVSAEVVTKREPLTIGELFSYMKQESAKEAFFECTATIDDVVHGSPWYYISCSGCHTKATKGPTSLMCTKCGKVNIAGVPQYRAKLSVYDNSAQAIFVLLGDAGCELTGKHASELVRSYFEVNGNKGDDHEVPVPEALISTIGQRHKFCVKVTEHNLSGKTRALTVTKILTLATPPVTESLEGNHNTAATEETFETGNDVREASQSRVDTSEGSKRSFDSAEIEGTKRPKCGK